MRSCLCYFLRLPEVERHTYICKWSRKPFPIWYLFKQLECSLAQYKMSPSGPVIVNLFQNMDWIWIMCHLGSLWLVKSFFFFFRFGPIHLPPVLLLTSSQYFTGLNFLLDHKRVIIFQGSKTREDGFIIGPFKNNTSQVNFLWRFRFFCHCHLYFLLISR